MTSRYGVRGLVAIAFWAAIGLAVAVMVAPPAASDWRAYAVAVGSLGLYVAAWGAFVRERRQTRRWT